VAERILLKPPWSPTLGRVAEGVWLLRGDLRLAMNVYLLEDGGGVTAFDAGTRPMVRAVRKAAEKLGGLRWVVLGHSHTDHRGTAPFLGVPVYCHPDEVPYAESEEWPDYWDMSLLEVPSVRWLYRHYLHPRRWDGGAVEIAGTVSEGEEVCGFEVVHFPGHAPGQIGLWRESDRLALVSDTVYWADSARLRELDHPVVPHRAWNIDHEQARESVRKLAELDAALVCPGHTAPHSGPDLRDQLLRAAEEG
jgi:hydroxyacylglutathione hydrolase